LELAIQYSQVNRQEEALEILMTALLKDLNAQDGQMKKAMMDILSALGQGNPIAGQYRRQLYSLLY
jgi:putative thioredoxin